MDLDLWKQTDEGGEFDGKDNTNIFNILEEVEDINYNHVNRREGDEPEHGEILVSVDEQGNHLPDKDGMLRYKKPFHTTLQKKLAFLNQKHVVKHIHVEYPQEEDDDDDDDGPDEDPDDNGFLNMFGMNSNNSTESQKKVTKKVRAIFAYVDRIDKDDESSDEDESKLFESDQRNTDRIKMMGTVFQRQWIQEEKEDEDTGEKVEEEILDEKLDKFFNFAKEIDIDLKQLKTE
jgi:hypothetical protein